MAFIVEDRVLETATTTGTGDFTLAGAVTGFRAFSAVCSTNDTLTYYIEAVDASGVPAGDWETGLGTYSAANTLTRTTVARSSNANAAVSFAAGTKRVGLSLVTTNGVVQYKLIETLATTSGTSVTSAIIPATYSNLNIEILGVSHDDASNRSLRIELSDDGANWTAATIINGGVSAASTVYGGVFIPGYLKAGGIISAGAPALAADRTVANGITPFAWRIAAGIRYVRFSPAAGNFDAGSIKIWGI